MEFFYSHGFLPDTLLNNYYKNFLWNTIVLKNPHFSIVVSPSQFPPIGIAIPHLFNQNHKARYLEHTVKLENGTPHQNHA